MFTVSSHLEHLNLRQKNAEGYAKSTGQGQRHVKLTPAWQQVSVLGTNYPGETSVRLPCRSLSRTVRTRTKQPKTKTCRNYPEVLNMLQEVLNMLHRGHHLVIFWSRNRSKASAHPFPQPTVRQTAAMPKLATRRWSSSCLRSTSPSEI